MCTGEIGDGDMRDVIRDVHLRSGLSWSLLEKILGVSHITMMIWSSGGQVDARHKDLIVRFARIVNEYDTGNPSATAIALFRTDDSGRSVYERFLTDRDSDIPEINGPVLTAAQLLEPNIHTV